MFANKFLIVLLTSSSFSLFDGKDSYRYSFPSSHTKYSEIIDEQKFKEELQTFLEKFTFKNEIVVILLSEELTFTYNNTNTHKEQSIENVLELVPLTKSTIATFSVFNGKNKVIYFTNKKFYESITTVLVNNGLKIFSVTPLAIVRSKVTFQTVDQQTVQKILHEKKLFKTYNFCREDFNEKVKNNKVTDQLFSDDVSETKKTSTRMRWLVLLLIIVVIIFCLLFYIGKI